MGGAEMGGAEMGGRCRTLQAVIARLNAVIATKVGTILNGVLIACLSSIVPPQLWQSGNCCTIAWSNKRGVYLPVHHAIVVSTAVSKAMLYFPYHIAGESSKNVGWLLARITDRVFAAFLSFSFAYLCVPGFSVRSGEVV